jgi:hypothetical protein
MHEIRGKALAIVTKIIVGFVVSRTGLKNVFGHKVSIFREEFKKAIGIISLFIIEVISEIAGMYY